MDSCFDLLGSRQHGVAAKKIEQQDWEPIVYDDDTQIQMFADWSMSYAKRVTLTIGKNPEYHFVVAIRRFLSHCSTVIVLMLMSDRLTASISSSTEKRVNYSQVKGRSSNTLYALL